nr:hypothetical protein [Tanacetum cinerariifolium]
MAVPEIHSDRQRCGRRFWGCPPARHEFGGCPPARHKFGGTRHGVWVAIWLYVNGFGVGEKRYVVVMGTWGWQRKRGLVVNGDKSRYGGKLLNFFEKGMKRAGGYWGGKRFTTKCDLFIVKCEGKLCGSGDKREKGRGVRGLRLGRIPEVVVCAVVELLWGVEGFVGVERGLWSAISDCISERNPEIKQFRRASLDNPVDGPKRVSRAQINFGHAHPERTILD